MTRCVSAHHLRPACVTDKQGVKRRRVTSYIPEEEFTPGATALDILTLQDIRAEYTAVITCLQLGQDFPHFLQQGQSLRYALPE